MRIQVSADDVQLAVVRGTEGSFSPTIQSARNGSALLELNRSELEDGLMAFVQAAVDEYGAQIQSAELSLSSVSDLALAASLKIKGRKLLNFTVTIAARAAVDKQLAVTISRLRAQGDGLTGVAVARLIGPKLKAYEGVSFDLAPEVLKNVRLTGLRVEAADRVCISAAFQV
jgi:hypothetical protein